MYVFTQPILHTIHRYAINKLGASNHAPVIFWKRYQQSDGDLRGRCSAITSQCDVDKDPTAIFFVFSTICLSTASSPSVQPRLGVFLRFVQGAGTAAELAGAGGCDLDFLFF